MELNLDKFRVFVENHIRPHWEAHDETWPFRPGGGELYIQEKVLNKAAPFLTLDSIKTNAKVNLISAIQSHLNLLSQFEGSFAKYFIEIGDEDEIRDKFLFLLHETEVSLEQRIGSILEWAKVHALPDEGKKAGINPTVCSYFLAMAHPKQYPYCKPTAYNAIVDNFLNRSERRNDPVERILHCQIIYKHLLKFLENDYGLIDGNLLDVHSLCYFLSEKTKGQTKSPKKKDQLIFSELDDTETGPKSVEKAYWWLNANPKIWNFIDTSVGERQIYTAYNIKGNKRRIFKYFEAVKPGDTILGYVASPNREIVAECSVTKGLHKSDEGLGIEFEKKMQFLETVSLEELKAIPELSGCEPLINNQGSLFKVTDTEYEIIRAIIDDKNDNHPVKPYSIKSSLMLLFITESKFHNILDRIKFKKNLVLQGPPGVGKTFIARHIAYALMGVEDKRRTSMIQFHQSYSYEDFMQGFRPNSEGKFDLKNGVFYEFCRKAQRDPGNPYVFIIDEINRGNLSKIFGEMFMLIEADKRGPDYAMPLTYAQGLGDTFFIPDNLYLIGTMNTADRSLAMVDYALRRRFCFINLEPAFGNEKFKKFLVNRGVEETVVDKVIDRMMQLNKRIAEDQKNLGRGYCIGHSYLCPSDNHQVYDNAWYENVVRTEIEPLLEEYWFDDPDKARKRVDQLLS